MDDHKDQDISKKGQTMQIEDPGDPRIQLLREFYPDMWRQIIITSGESEEAIEIIVGDVTMRIPPHVVKALRELPAYDSS